MDILNQFIGFLIGIISSWFFWRMLLQVKPKIKVSPVLAYDVEKGILAIKVINLGRRQAMDIQIHRFSIGEIKPNQRLTTIVVGNIQRVELPALGPIQDLKKLWTLSTAFVFKASNGTELVNILKASNEGERRLILTISSTDGLSGTKVVQQITYRSEDIRQGTFIKGVDFQITPSITVNQTDNITDSDDD